jgi:hypothetical protein
VSVAIVSVIVLLVVAGITTILVLSSRLRSEIADLLAVFDHTERRLTPLVATVRTDRERLAARLERLTEPGIDPDQR